MGFRPATSRAQLDAYGLKAVGAHFNYAELDGDLPKVIAQAQALGVEYVEVPVIPHHPVQFSAADARAAAAKFNTGGAAIKDGGMKFGYHTHGYEFQLREGEGDRTPFDILVQATRPDLVFLEMDVFWVAHAGVDPVQLLAKYPGRWQPRCTSRTCAPAPAPTIPVPRRRRMMCRSAKGRFPGSAVLRSAREAGIAYYFIEDASPRGPRAGISPRGLRYLEARFIFDPKWVGPGGPLVRPTSRKRPE